MAYKIYKWVWGGITSTWPIHFRQGETLHSCHGGWVGTQIIWRVKESPLMQSYGNKSLPFCQIRFGEIVVSGSGSDVTKDKTVNFFYTLLFKKFDFAANVKHFCSIWPVKDNYKTIFLMPLSSTLYDFAYDPVPDHDKSRKSDPDPHRKVCGFEVMLNSEKKFLGYTKREKVWSWKYIPEHLIVLPLSSSPPPPPTTPNDGGGGVGGQMTFLRRVS
jgi:hypothetical protein